MKPPNGQRSLTVIWSDDDDCYIAWWSRHARRYTYVSAFGDTPVSAVRELMIATKLVDRVIAEDAPKESAK